MCPGQLTGFYEQCDGFADQRCELGRVQDAGQHLSRRHGQLVAYIFHNFYDRQPFVRVKHRMRLFAEINLRPGHGHA
jgi:hypothetical protein